MKDSYYFPAEWSPHVGTWLAWPHNRSDWPGKMAVIAWVYGEIVRHLARGEEVRLLVNGPTEAERARALLAKTGADLSRVRFFHWPTNRGWTRDYGPIGVRDAKDAPVLLDFQFNAWARYPHWQLDNQIPARAAEALGVRCLRPQHQGRPTVLEGGAIDGNGASTLLTTEECLLDTQRQVRNSGFTRKDYERVFETYLGIRQTIWLGRGIVGDDTHGHVDDICRFVSADTVVLAVTEDSADANYAACQENRERLEGVQLVDGSALQVVHLPLPAPLYFQGQRLPASYANFYIANAAVLVPTFNDAQDRVALGILSDLFPDRPVIGIHAVDLVLGLGTLHCLTQQAIV